ncbi:MAG TPA: sigma-70 family RNA polymerase sigma factor [Polyangiaceae bacterium]|nr:sigma-70 family RNA polymerase sigma factor [Polyangiaceae bacterium]
MKVGPTEDSKQVQGIEVPLTVTTIEDSLVQSCVAGDSRAWHSLHRRYYPVAVAFLRKLGARESDIEDACQDVFVELFRYLPSFRGQADLKTWLYRLCVTQARRVRSRSRIIRVIRERLQNDLPAHPTVPPATMTESTVFKRISSALDRMNEGDRLVFVLYEFEGLPGKQIATIAECPEATVWRRLHYARRIFRDALGLGESEAVGNE